MLINIFSFISKEMTVLLTAAMPIIELRGAIPVGISLGLTPVHATILSFFGSMVPVPFILFGIRPVFKYMRTTKLLSPLVDRLTNKSVSKSSHKIQKYGAWALVTFVAIPLPGTGVWSASLAAALLDIRFKWAFPAILLGNLIAALAVMGLSHGVLGVVG